MALEKESNSTSNGLEWRMRVNGGSSKALAPSEGHISIMLLGLKCLASRVISKASFFRKAWELARGDPRKVAHCPKVGIALTAVSLFYYMRPLYEGVGGNAMWAVMTVVVVFENTVGATLCKCINRIFGTTLAGFLAVGIHWVADKSGDKFEPFIMGISVFVLASMVTFSRFIPSIKARFDYGAMIFILTFSLVSVSGYRVDKLLDMARQRMSTILIGTSLCIFIIMLICPIWAGQELHVLVARNMEKLADSLDGCVCEYFNGSEESGESNKDSSKALFGYRCVLGSKASEETMANFARWEPAHGGFSFRHPWKQYVKIGVAMRSCAYCVEALNGCIDAEKKVSEQLRKRIRGACLEVSSSSSSLIHELANVIKTMKRSSSIDFLIGKMSRSVRDLRNDLKSLPSLLVSEPIFEGIGNPQEKKMEPIDPTQTSSIPVVEIVPLVTLTSLLIEIAARIKGIVDEVEALAELAQFEPVEDEKVKKDNPGRDSVRST